MIRVRLGIEGITGQPLDTITFFNLIYISADNIVSSPIKPFEKTTYPEQEGENIYNKTVDDAFDYKVTWLIEADNEQDANDIISGFNSIIINNNNGVKEFRRVTFCNDYKKVKIVGIPSPISEATEFWRDAKGKQHDVVKVEWTIRVDKPSLCDFNYSE